MSRPSSPIRPVLALFLTERRGLLIAGFVLAITTALSGLALLGLSAWFITATGLAGLSVAAMASFDVFSPAAMIRLLALGRTAARYGERLVTHEATLGVLATLRERLFRGWAGPGAARRLLARPATLLFRLTGDIDALDALYPRILVPAVAAIVTALVAGFALALVDLRLGATIGGLLVLVGLLAPVLAARLGAKAARRRGAGLEAIRARTVDLVAGQTELATAGRLPAQVAAIRRADRYLSDADNRLNAVETGTGALVALTGAGALAAALLLSGWLVELGVASAPVAAFTLLIAFAALEPFAGLRRGAAELARTLIAVRRIGPRLAAEPDPAPPVMPEQGRAVQLAGVRFRPEGAVDDTLDVADLAIPVGHRVAIVGPSGAGKSTLLDLIAGERHPDAGHVAALPGCLFGQRTDLFADDLAGNLRLARPDADDATLHRALADAGLTAAVAALPDGLATRLGEGGQGLSGGQSRRLALARLFLRDTPLWLVDEPTDGLDARTAGDVLARLADHAGGRTLVIATHLRREAELADRLIRLEHGRVVADLARGTPEFAAQMARLRPD
ncbi:amino acid ABC transporter ATP-binding/permease protein [Segnochrobactraceae bacterium EtOH-i3]